ncbi:MAG: CGNR zinc finger domain-containing protein, partial [Roseiflexaceae bacterium]|nr:CGNR zinc finger domain-containing protein [Roseiflexaceae bacterium]
AAHIQHTCLIDTHEHLHGEQRYVEQGPDLLQDLFDNYRAGTRRWCSMQTCGNRHKVQRFRATHKPQNVSH